MVICEKLSWLHTLTIPISYHIIYSTTNNE